MDELAERMGIDPIELRRVNEPAEDPEKKVPFSSRKLIDALDDGAGGSVGASVASPASAARANG